MKILMAESGCIYVPKEIYDECDKHGGISEQVYRCMRAEYYIPKTESNDDKLIKACEEYGLDKLAFDFGLYVVDIPDESTDWIAYGRTDERDRVLYVVDGKIKGYCDENINNTKFNPRYRNSAWGFDD